MPSKTPCVTVLDLPDDRKAILAAAHTLRAGILPLPEFISPSIKKEIVGRKHCAQMPLIK